MSDIEICLTLNLTFEGLGVKGSASNLPIYYFQLLFMSNILPCEKTSFKRYSTKFDLSVSI